MLVLRTLVQLLSHQLTLLSGMVSMNIVRLHLWKVELLWPKDGARSSNSNPANEGLSWDLEVLHCPKANECSCSSESSLAMNSNSSMVGLSEMVLNDVEELVDDSVRGSRAIHKEEVVVGD